MMIMIMMITIMMMTTTTTTTTRAMTIIMMTVVTVNFQLTYIKVSQVDEDEHVDPPPSASWTDLDLQQTFTIPADISVDEGDSVIAWVRASDVMGNDLIQRAHVTFDTTPADVEELKFRMNEQVPGIDFSST